MFKDGHKKWRVVEYVNDLDDVFFQVHYTYRWWPLWHTEERCAGWDAYKPREFKTYDKAEQWILNTIEYRKSVRRKNARKRV